MRNLNEEKKKSRTRKKILERKVNDRRNQNDIQAISRKKEKNITLTRTLKSETGERRRKRKSKRDRETEKDQELEQERNEQAWIKGRDGRAAVEVWEDEVEEGRQTEEPRGV